MKGLVLFCFVLLSHVFVNAQNIPVYHWAEHLSYQNAKLILEVDNVIYCVTENGLFYYDKDSYLVSRLSKITGLSDISIDAMGYDQENRILILAYQNENVDLIKDGNIINIPDIKLKEIFGEKRISNIMCKNGIAYLSSSFGLVLLDLINEEIIDTYKLFLNENECEIYNMTIANNHIVLSTDCGGFQADINSPFLNDFNNWEVISSTSHITDILFSKTNDTAIFVSNHLSSTFPNNIDLFVDSISTNYYCPGLKEVTFFNNKLHRIYDDKIIICSGLNLNNSDTIYGSQLDSVNYSITDITGNIWVADGLNSLLKLQNFESYSEIKPNGPHHNDIYKIEYGQGTLTVLHNTKHNSASKTSDLIDWEIISPVRNAVCSETLSGETYYGSSLNGLYKITNSSIVRYNKQNTQNVLDSSDFVSNLISDENGNLWGTVSYSSLPLFVKTANGDWEDFYMPQVGSLRNIKNFIIDDFGQKWGSLTGSDKGIFVFDDNQTIDDKSDDQYKVLNSSLGNGNLPSSEVYSIANDLEGDLWVGTKTGICIFYSPENVFSGDDFDAEQIIVEENGIGQYLLESETVLSIAIDGSNRKWIGTLGSGLYLLSSEGTEEIYHFTIENSPLLSNTILEIVINGETSEVYLSTEKGLMVFRGDATDAAITQSNLDIFPNPVREGYNGYISIDGLVSKSEVKITDINGNLIYATTSNGGMATWNGKDKNNNRVSTGVYLIFSSDQFGVEKSVGKILFIH